MIYIIGLAHRAQARRRDSVETDAQRMFAGHLRSVVTELKPTYIAEEYSLEVLNERSEESIAEGIAIEYGIEHRFCDPTSDERSALKYRDYTSLFHELMISNDEDLTIEELHLKARAIEIARYFPVRERFWLEKLNGWRDRHGIFICGDGHVEGFSSLLEANQIPYRVLVRGIGLTSEDRHFEEAVQYLRQHPGLAHWNNS